ncbi:MAG: helix-turn-helix transcriptional regulator [Planctomycetota bacterium]
MEDLFGGPLVVTCAVVESIVEMPRWRMLHAHATRGVADIDGVALGLRRHGKEARYRAEGDSVVGVMPLAGDEGLRSIVVKLDVVDEWDGMSEALGVVRSLGVPLHEHFVHRFLAGELRRRELLAKLSPSQRELVPLLVEGMTEEQIGVRTGRSKHTVHDHAKRIYRAWGVTSRHELRQLWGGNHMS